MALVSKHFNARIIKSAGDSLILYFPQTCEAASKPAFRDVLECCTTIRDARCIINTKLHEEGLSSVDYRVSADYGNVEVARSKTLQNEDLFGCTMNLCAKINSRAPRNGIVIGGDLYQILKTLDFNNYYFEPMGEYSIGLKYSYPLYSVTGKSRANADADVLKLFRRPPACAERCVQSMPKKPDAARILLVDDEADIAGTYKMVLSSEGYEVDCFTDPRQAVNHFASRPEHSYYHLVITDIRMPEINGIQFYKIIKAINARTRIIFVTALDAARELLSIYPEIRQNDVLQKPVSYNALVQRVRNALA